MEQLEFEQAIIKRLHTAGMTGVAILADLFSRSAKPQLEETVVMELITFLRQHTSAAISIFFKEFKDTALEHSSAAFRTFLNQNKCELVATDRMIEVAVPPRKDGKPSIYEKCFIPGNFLSSGLKIICSTASIHRHHAIEYRWDCTTELALFASVTRYDWRKITRKDAIQVLRGELAHIYDEIKLISGLEQLFCITDSREILITNEHLPIRRTLRNGEVKYSII